jgi:hypothetical protein
VSGKADFSTKNTKKEKITKSAKKRETRRRHIIFLLQGASVFARWNELRVRRDLRALGVKIHENPPREIVPADKETMRPHPPSPGGPGPSLPREAAGEGFYGWGLFGG